jgi:hypothetical protein
MKGNEMLGQAKRELARYVRGPRRSLQRRFRSIWWMVRLNSLGRRPQVGRSLAEVDAYALAAMRSEYPGFTPELA